MRRFAMIAASLLTTVAAFLTGATSAFAVNTDPSGDGSQVARFSHSAGLAVWQISLLVAAGIVAVMMATALVRWTSRRVTVRHAIH